MLGKLITKAKELDIQYIGYYVELEEKYNTPKYCRQVISDTYKNDWKELISHAYENDNDSKLGSYYIVNPDMKNPNIRYNKRTFEIDRILITRFRTGSHNLFVETGRYRNPRVKREERLFLCNEDI